MKVNAGFGLIDCLIALSILALTFTLSLPKLKAFTKLESHEKESRFQLSDRNTPQQKTHCKQVNTDEYPREKLCHTKHQKAVSFAYIEVSK